MSSVASRTRAKRARTASPPPPGEQGAQQHYHPRTVTPGEFAEFREQIGDSLKGITDTITLITSQLRELQADKAAPAVVNMDRELLSPEDESPTVTDPVWLAQPKTGVQIQPGGADAVNFPFDPYLVSRTSTTSNATHARASPEPARMVPSASKGLQSTPVFGATTSHPNLPTSSTQTPPTTTQDLADRYGQYPNIALQQRSSTVPQTPAGPHGASGSQPPRVWGCKVFSEVLASVRKSAKLPGGPYLGTGDSRCLGEFLRELEVDLTFAAGDPVWKLAFLLNMLSHGVQAEILQTYALVHGQPIENHLAEGHYVFVLEAVQQIIRQVYSTADDRRKVINKFNSLKIGKATIAQYDYQFDLLRTEVQIISGQSLSEDTVMAHYLNGLGEDAQSFAEVHLSGVTSFAELRRRVRAFWKSEENRSLRNAFAAAACTCAKTTSGCQLETGSAAAVAVPGSGLKFPCGQGCGHTPDPTQRDLCLRCGKPRHRARWCRQPQPADSQDRCGVCGCRGHRTEACPVQGAASHCVRCGGNGHRASVCRGSPPARPSNDQPQPSPDSSTRAAAATSVDLLYSEEKAEPETLQEFLGCFAMETTQLMNQHSSDNSPQACIPEVFMYDFSLLPKTGSQEFLLKKSTVISILLDTGAGKSFVKESWVKQNTSFVHDFRRTTDPLKVQCANGTTFYTNRQVSLEVLHDGQPYTWWFYVTALLSHDIICGMDFLRGLSLTLKLALGSQQVYRQPPEPDETTDLDAIARAVTTISRRSQVAEDLFGQDTVLCGADKPLHMLADDTLVDIILEAQSLPNSHPEPIRRHVHRIPWVSEARPNRRRSLRRAKQMSTKLLEKLKKDPQAYRQCCDQVHMLVERGYARPAAEEEISHAYGLLVVRRASSTTTPLRVVLDGSTLRGFVSAGVIYDRTVVTPLLVLRRYAFFTLADLEKAFYSLSIISDDCGAQGYYWEGQWYMLLRAGMGLPSSPSMLQTSMQVTLKEFDEDIAPRLRLGPYCVRSFMDDIAQGATTVVDRNCLAEGVNKTITSNGFSEQKCKRIQNLVNGIDSGDDKPGALFGVQWDSSRDALSLSPVPSPGELQGDDRLPSPVTLRGYISWLNSHFDPMGLYLQEAMTGRLLLRSIVRAGLGLDDALPSDLYKRALLLQESYEKAAPTPRLVQGDTLVVACDASIIGWACTVTDMHGVRLYARGGLHDAGHEQWSIPRLELYALVEARKIVDSLLRDDPVVRRVILVSDSAINVQRLTSKGSISSKLVPWDVRTIAAMRLWLSSAPVVLGHVRGSANPADCASRAISPNSYDFEQYKETLLHYANSFEVMRERLTRVDADKGDDIETYQLSEDTVASLREAEASVADEPQVVSLVEQVLAAQSSDPFCQQIRRALAHEPVELSTTEVQRLRRTYVLDSQGNICRSHAVCGSQYYVPVASRPTIFSMLHDLYAHPGSNKLYGIILQTYHLYWPKMVRDIRQWTTTCRVCIISRRQRAEPPSYGTQIRSSQLWELLAVDIGGPYVGTTSTTAIPVAPYSLILTESVTRYMVARELPSKSGKDVSRVLEQLFWEYGFPRALATDADVVLCKGEVKAVCQKYGIVRVPHPPYGCIRAWWEPGHHLLHLALRQLIAAEGADEVDWSRFLPQAVWVCNNATLPLASVDGERYTPCDLVRLCGSSPPPMWRPTDETSDELKAYLARHYVEPSKTSISRRQARRAEAADLFKEYLRSWDIHRLRLLDNLDASRRNRQPEGKHIEVGDIVRVHRPSTKLAMSWSSKLYKVMELRAQIARLRPECAKPGQPDEVQYVFNLSVASDVDVSDVAERFVDPPPATKRRAPVPAVPPQADLRDPQQTADRAARAARRSAARDALGGGEC